MSIPRWTPPIEPSPLEARILKRLKRHRKLFALLRTHRHTIFDEAFQTELEAMYRDTGAGIAPKPPAMMCMVVLLQAYTQASDAEAVEASVMDRRWSMVLDCLDADKPPFSQGSLQNFRERLIANDMDRRLLERSVEVARESGAFDWKKLPKEITVAMDSRPLLGAGRVEDTFNLLGHAARKIVDSVAKQTGSSREQVCAEAGCELFAASSIKAGLDIDWWDKQQKNGAIHRLVTEVESLVGWLDQHLDKLSNQAPIQTCLQALDQFQNQDLERGDDGRAAIRKGVAKDRRVSLEDPDMRHGRKSKSKAFSGYKEHIAADLSTQLILACAITPANAPERDAADTLKAEIDEQGFEIAQLIVDRGYIESDAVDEIEREGGEVLCKPWRSDINRDALFAKSAFDINIRDKTITCPEGNIASFEFGKTVEFDPKDCASCSQRNQCTKRPLGRGRTVSILKHEARQKRLRKLGASKKGRQKLRARTGIEHRLAHLAARKGPRARYRGIRKNVFDTRRSAALQNLELIQRQCAKLAA
jgi:hypothetical protein